MFEGKLTFAVACRCSTHVFQSRGDGSAVEEEEGGEDSAFVQ